MLEATCPTAMLRSRTRGSSSCWSRLAPRREQPVSISGSAEAAGRALLSTSSRHSATTRACRPGAARDGLTSPRDRSEEAARFTSSGPGWSTPSARGTGWKPHGRGRVPRAPSRSTGRCPWKPGIERCRALRERDRRRARARAPKVGLALKRCCWRCCGDVDGARALHDEADRHQSRTFTPPPAVGGPPTLHAHESSSSLRALPSAQRASPATRPSGAPTRRCTTTTRARPLPGCWA